MVYAVVYCRISCAIEGTKSRNILQQRSYKTTRPVYSSQGNLGSLTEWDEGAM